MAGFWGADVASLRSLAASFDRAADDLASTSTTLDGLVHTHTAWTGPSADRFRQQWVSADRATITAAVHGLRDASSRLRANALAQEQVSQTDGRAAAPELGAGDHADSGGLPFGLEYLKQFSDMQGQADIAARLAGGIHNAFGGEFKDLEHALGWTRNDEILQGLGRFVRGESWGGLVQKLGWSVGDAANALRADAGAPARALGEAASGIGRLAEPLAMAGKALGPIGVLAGGYQTVEDLRSGDKTMAAIDGASTAMMAAALIPSPATPFLVAGATAAFGIGEVYKHWDAVESGADALVSAGNSALHETEGLANDVASAAKKLWPF